MELVVDGTLWFWRGPSPYHFVRVPEELSAQLRSVSGAVTYGWGMIPVSARIGSTEWTTSLFPKDGGYLVPIKDWVRTEVVIDVCDPVRVRLVVEGG